MNFISFVKTVINLLPKTNDKFKCKECHELISKNSSWHYCLDRFVYNIFINEED